MPDDTISKPRAKRIRLSAQIAALVCAGAAVAAVLVGVPLLRGEPVPAISITDVKADANQKYAQIIANRSAQAEETEDFPPDLAMIAGMLGEVGNAPEIKQATTEGPDEGEGGSAEPTPPPAKVGKTRFVGTVAIGDRVMALVTAGGSQRIMAPGDEKVLPLVDGDSATPPRVKIRSVTNDRVVLVEDGVERTIERAERTGIAVSTSAASVPPAPASNPSGSPRAEDTVRPDGRPMTTDDVRPVNPDDYRREDGTIDYEALREAARERARQRQEIRRQRREEAGDEN